MSYAIYKIKKLYPDGIVIGLNKKYPNIYNYLRLESANNGFEKLGDYLAQFGLVYARKTREPKAEQDVIGIIEKIKELYNTSEVRGLATEHPEIYRELIKIVKDNETTVREFLNKFDIKYKGEYSNVDPGSANRLNKEFGISLADIARIADVSRQRIDQVKKGQIKKEDCWTNKKLTLDEKELIEIMISEEIFTFEFDETKVNIINDCAGNVVIIVKNGSDVKCLFHEDIDDEILEKIKNKRMDILVGVDFEVLKKCKKVYIMKQPCLSCAEHPELIAQGKKIHKMERNKYAELLGVTRFVSSKEHTDDCLINFFEEHLINGEVYISSNPENQWIRSYASRVAKMGLDKFVEFFGYKKSTYDYSAMFEETKRKYQEILKDYLIEGSATVVDISDNFQLLRNLRSIARIHNMSLDELLLQMGFERISAKKNTIFEKIDVLEEKFKENHDAIGEYDIERFKRNTVLVNEMKTIYGHRCQICGEDETYCIKQKDGQNYVEVHHIKPLSQSIDTEDRELDTIDNMIVVCAHHHKLLHYQNGGNFKLSLENGLNLTNDEGDIIPIKVDYHLKRKNFSI